MHEMTTSRFAFRASLVCLVLAVILLTACSDSPPASIANPPAYPGVTKVEERTLDDNDRLLHIFKSVTFATQDAPEAVLKFYREQLEKDGWAAEEFQPDPQALMFRWESYEDPTTYYWCEVVTRQGEGGMTSVRVDLRDSAGN